MRRARPKVAGYLESHNGVRQPIRGEAAEYSLEVVRHADDSRGVCTPLDRSAVAGSA